MGDGEVVVTFHALEGENELLRLGPVRLEPNQPRRLRGLAPSRSWLEGGGLLVRALAAIAFDAGDRDAAIAALEPATGEDHHQGFLVKGDFRVGKQELAETCAGHVGNGRRAADDELAAGCFRRPRF